MKWTGGWLDRNPDALERDKLVKRIATQLDISSPRQLPNLIRVSYSDTNPLRAYRVTRRFGELIIQESLAERARESREAFEFADSQAQLYARRLKDSETRLNDYRRAHPDAEVLVHPECGCAGQVIYAMGRGDISPDRVHIASTERMIQLTRERPAREFIIATETGIMHRMQQTAPDKTFLAADPEAVCAYMKTITLPRVRDALVLDQFEITVPGDIAERAKLSLERMVSLGR